MAVVGVDLGGTKCLGVALDDGRVVAETRVATAKGAQPLLAEILDLVEELEGYGAIEAVGVGAPGLVDRDGVLRFAPNLSLGGTELDVRSPLEARLGVPEEVEIVQRIGVDPHPHGPGAEPGRPSPPPGQHRRGVRDRHSVPAQPRG